MAIDFLILIVLLLSFFINLLALAAFWVTPGLRTTANRFTINLLVINLVGCLILAPTLFLTNDFNLNTFSTNNRTNTKTTTTIIAAATTTTATLETKPETEATVLLGENDQRSTLQLTHDDSIEFYAKSGNNQMIIRHNGQIVERDGIILQHKDDNVYDNSNENSIESFEKHNDNDTNNKTKHTIKTIYKCNATYCRELTIDENNEGLIIQEIEESNFPTNNNNDNDNNGQFSYYDRRQYHKRQHHLYGNPKQINTSLYINKRSWCIDMAAALSAMAVLLIVGDTWCAVTDPLRYQSRISGIKTWTLIALTWAIGLFFGGLSAFRDFNFDFDSASSNDAILNKQKRYALENHTFYTLSSANNIFSMIFACLYFLIIILLPFGIVCGMYWRIFSEARGNGLRMRQNGSSPLLQSSLNLHQGHGQSNLQHYANSLCAHRNSISSNSSQGCSGGSSVGVGIICNSQTQIDQMKRASPAFHRRDSAAKVLLPPITDDGLSDENDMDNIDNIKVQHEQNGQHQQNQQHIILTLQTASGEIKRNYSVRQLEVLMATSQDFVAQSNLTMGMRQVHSTPNLQRSINLPHTEEEMYSPHLLGGPLNGMPITGRHQPLYQSNRLTHNHYQTHFNHTHNHQLQNCQHHHQHQHQHQQHHHHHSMPTTRQSSLQIPAIQASPKSLSYMSSLRHRLSNASSLFKYREESRAARISILVVIMFLVSYLPYGFLVLLQSRIPSANFKHSSQLAIFMILLANLSSPFIFAYRNKRVRKGVQRLLHCDLQRKNNSPCHQNQYHTTNNHHMQQHQQQQHSQHQQQHCHKHQQCNNSSNAKYCCNSLQKNSCRTSNYANHYGYYLTPQNSLASNSSTVTAFNYNNNNNCNDGNSSSNNNNNNNKMSNLKKNLSCNAIINFTLPKYSHNTIDAQRTISIEDEQEENVINVQQQQQQQQQQPQQHQHVEQETSVETIIASKQQQQQQQKRSRPVLQRGITIIEQMPLNEEENNHHLDIITPPIKYKLINWFHNSNKNKQKFSSTQVRSDHLHHHHQHQTLTVEPADV